VDPQAALHLAAELAPGFMGGPERHALAAAYEVAEQAFECRAWGRTPS
jgi:hypothetical protein